jgi:hypothetical protein
MQTLHVYIESGFMVVELSSVGLTILERDGLCFCVDVRSRETFHVHNVTYITYIHKFLGPSAPLARWTGA